jgi:lipopolysaccharide transport system ATP-binding protein
MKGAIMSNSVIKIDRITKEYRLGAIGGRTLNSDIQSWWARVRGKEDPNGKVGQSGIRNERFLALNNVSFEVKQGDTLGIIGHNGAGKSTLLKLLSRVTAPTKGTISYNGRIASMLEVGTGFHGELTGRENVFMNGAILGMSRAEITRKFDEIVEFAEMERFIDTPVKRYSSGMYVKLAFAVAAHLDSEILVMDEVLAVGDMKFQQKCLGKMGEVANKEGRTVLYVSHNMNTIRQLCNRAVVLQKGSVIYDGNVETGIQYYMNKYGNMSIINEYTQKARSEGFVQRLEIVELAVQNKKDMLFELNEKMQCVIRWKPYRDVDGIYIRTVFHYEDSTPAGMSFMTKPIHCKSNKFTETKIEYDFSGLATGRYYTDLYFYKPDGYGGVDNYDIIDSAFSFEISDSTGSINKLQWYHTGWGHSVLKPIKEIQVFDETLEQKFECIREEKVNIT